MWAPQYIRVATTKHQVGQLINNINLFLTVLEVGSPRSWCQQICYLVRLPSWFIAVFQLDVPLPKQKGWESSSMLSQGTPGPGFNLKFSQISDFWPKAGHNNHQNSDISSHPFLGGQEEETLQGERTALTFQPWPQSRRCSATELASSKHGIRTTVLMTIIA